MGPHQGRIYEGILEDLVQFFLLKISVELWIPCTKRPALSMLIKEERAGVQVVRASSIFPPLYYSSSNNCAHCLVLSHKCLVKADCLFYYPVQRNLGVPSMYMVMASGWWDSIWFYFLLDTLI